MGWGDTILTGIGALTGNTTIQSGVSFLSNLIKSNEAEKENKQAQNDYYKALAQQKQTAALASEVAKQRAVFEAAMKNRILEQTGTMGATLRAAQASMGAAPTVDTGRIKQDYQATKSAMMDDFTKLVSLVESQGRADQIERLGGAGSYAADQSRMNALIKQYAPELQKIDDAAYDSAVGRAGATYDLLNKSRTNTLNEIQGLYSPEISANTNLLTGGSTDIAAPSNIISGNLSDATATAKGAQKAAGDTSNTLSTSLGDILGRVFNPNGSQYWTTSLPNGDTINWNQPRYS